MKVKREEKFIFPLRKLLVCLMSYHLISPSAWRTKMKRKLPAMKELLMQICCTDTLTFSFNMIFTNDDDDTYYDEVCVCVFVTKNEHFLKRSVCLLVCRGLSLLP